MAFKYDGKFARDIGFLMDSQSISRIESPVGNANQGSIFSFLHFLLLCCCDGVFYCLFFFRLLGHIANGAVDQYLISVYSLGSGS